jgi:phage gp46-like protein
MLAITFDGQAVQGDFTFAATGAPEEALRNAVLLSLFTDGRAAPSDAIPDRSGDPRGVWSDLFAGRKGSRLWLLRREKLLEPVRVRAEVYAREALQWLIADGVADRVATTARLTPPDRLDLQIVIERDGRLLLDARHALLWQV